MADSLCNSLETHRIQDVPASMFYIPDFISEAEEAHILNSIPPKKWISLSRRRLQAIPAQLTANNTLAATSGLPSWLADPIVKRLNGLGLFSGAPHGVNHCLVNDYLPGQGIMPHEDGAAYFPVVATVSLGGSIVLDVVDKAAHAEERRSWRIMQEPRSLLVTTDAAYRETLHGIAEVAEDRDLDERTVVNWKLLGRKETFARNGGVNERSTRVSLTFRDVLQVSNIGMKLFGRR